MDGDSGSWVIKDDKLCGYIFSRVVNSLWAYMLPIEPVFEDIGRTLNIEDPTSVEVLTTPETTQVPPRPSEETERILRGEPFPHTAFRVESSTNTPHGKNADLSHEFEPSGSQPQQRHIRSSNDWPTSRTDSIDSIDIDDSTYDPSRPTCLSSIEHSRNIRDPVQHYFGCLRQTMKDEYFSTLPRSLQHRIESEVRRNQERLELLEQSKEGNDMVKALRSSRAQFRRRGGYPGLPPTNFEQASKVKGDALLDNLHLKSDVLIFKDSAPYTDLRFEGKFPDQYLPLTDILDFREDSPLAKDREAGMIRYFHLPANNMSWVEVRRSNSIFEVPISSVDYEIRKQYPGTIEKKQRTHRTCDHRTIIHNRR